MEANKQEYVDKMVGRIASMSGAVILLASIVSVAFFDNLKMGAGLMVPGIILFGFGLSCFRRRTLSIARGRNDNQSRAQ